MAVLGVITIVACHACWKPYVSLFLCHSLVVHTNYVIIVHKYLSPFMSGVSWCTKQIHWVDGYVAFVSFTGQNYSIFKSIKPIMCYRYMYIVVGWSVDMNLLEETDFFWKIHNERHYKTNRYKHKSLLWLIKYFVFKNVTLLLNQIHYIKMEHKCFDDDWCQKNRNKSCFFIHWMNELRS